MIERTTLRRVLLLIAVLTVISGLVQAVAPGRLLSLLSAESTAASRHFFGIVGMFMVLFGGLLWHALTSGSAQPIPVLWAALQKFGASAAVGLGVMHGVFSPVALGVAGFDLLSGILALMYWWMVAE
jgi:hypothetical protein